MKILYVKNNMHVKNNNALLNYKNTNLYVIENTDLLDRLDLTQFDCVYSPCLPINVNKYPNTKFIFGPHFSVFPENNHMNTIRGKNTVYVQPSDWARDVWKYNPLCQNIRVESLPFGVDTVKFNEVMPFEKKTSVFLYYKSRRPDELEVLLTFLKKLNIHVYVFSYMSKYNETDYLKCLQNSKFGIWLGRHESQGFALEEALSCNVPLIVWDVKSMNQEYGYNYSDIPATVIPYWDNRCGEYFYNANEIEPVFARFLSKLSTYAPREYILENLSMDVCENKLNNIITNI
jgi:hypothetical protein